MDNKDYESDIEDEIIELHVDLEANALFKSKTLSEYWSNINTATKYSKLRTVTEPFLLVFHTSYIAETGLSHVDEIFTKQSSRLRL